MNFVIDDKLIIVKYVFILFYIVFREISYSCSVMDGDMLIFDSESEVEEEGEIICIVLEIECFSEEFLKGELILREFLEDKDRD